MLLKVILLSPASKKKKVSLKPPSHNLTQSSALDVNIRSEWFAICCPFSVL